jgi:hypothetical protein
VRVAPAATIVTSGMVGGVMRVVCSYGAFALRANRKRTASEPQRDL